MHVIIPSAKLVPEELWSLGKLPSVIYPVNQKIVFDYLHERYSRENFRVVAYEKADKVKRRLDGYSNTEVITLNGLKDLGFSIKIGLGGVKGKVVINFGDTIIFDESIANSEPDSFYYSVDEISSTWTFFEEKDGVITKVIDKRSDVSGCGKLFCGAFCLGKGEYFLECLERSEIVGGNTFYNALILYSQQYPMKPIKAENWLDIGHQDRYYASQIEVKAREFNHIRIDKDRGILTKYSDNTEKFIGEIKWYLKLPSDVEYMRPRIFAYSTEYEHPYVSMEYYAYHTIHELYLYGDLSQTQWIDIFRRIRFVIRDLSRYTIVDESINKSLEDMYLNKTIKRLDKLRINNLFANYFTSPIIVNGRKYRRLDEVIEILKQIIPDKLCRADAFNIIHGDLCFSNIMVDSNFNFIKVIDPRGKFGEYDIYGDPRYELAKLFHSVDGKYDYIIRDLFNVNYSSTTIEYAIRDRERDYDIFELFLRVFREDLTDSREEVELIESLLFLSMIPLHGESLNEQMVMLATGLDILNRVVDITVEDNK